ncbi:telomere stability and silencing-domain-containing protein [Lipomyces arxii]|uniref:telomere stability and silencing-domain-containing protein n=1 Tax=Lipomyces arxii TaxID=56418 RepID=UPI0034CE3C1D
MEKVFVSVETFSGLRSLHFEAGLNAQDIVNTVYSHLPVVLQNSTYLTFRSGKLFTAESVVANDVDLCLSVRVCGGKGGFGSQLRAQGGRMASRRKRGVNDESSKDNYRNLDGRRMRSVRQAKELAEYLESAPQRLKDEARAKREKLQALIAMQPPGSNARFDDTAFLEESEETIETLKRLVEESVKQHGGVELHMSEAEDEDVDDEVESSQEEESRPRVASTSRGSSSSSANSVRKPKLARFFDDDEDNEDEDEDEDEDE